MLDAIDPLETPGVPLAAPQPRSPLPLLGLLLGLAACDPSEDDTKADAGDLEETDTDTGSDTDTDTGTEPLDEDGDGFSIDEDCDDTDAAIHPGAQEVGSDGLDNDCDSAVDCDDTDLIGDWVGDVSGADVPTFCDGYCTRSITGNLQVTDTALTDLRGLSCLSSVGGYA